MVKRLRLKSLACVALLGSPVLSGCVTYRVNHEFGMRSDYIERGTQIGESPTTAYLEFQGRHGAETVYYRSEIKRSDLFGLSSHEFRELRPKRQRIKPADLQSAGSTHCLVFESQQRHSTVVRDSCSTFTILITQISLGQYLYRDGFHKALMPIVLPLAWVADIALTPAYIFAAIGLMTSKRSLM